MALDRDIAVLEGTELQRLDVDLENNVTEERQRLHLDTEEVNADADIVADPAEAGQGINLIQLGIMDDKFS